MVEKTIHRKNFAKNTFFLSIGYIILMIIFYSYFEILLNNTKYNLETDQFEWYYGPNGFFHNVNTIQLFILTLNIIFLLIQAALAYYVWFPVYKEMEMLKKDIEPAQTEISGWLNQNQYKLPSKQIVIIIALAGTIILSIIQGVMYTRINPEFQNLTIIPSIVTTLYFVLSILLAYITRKFNTGNN